MRHFWICLPYLLQRPAKTHNHIHISGDCFKSLCTSVGLQCQINQYFEDEGHKIILMASAEKIRKFTQEEFIYKQNKKRELGGKLPQDVKKIEEYINTIKQTAEEIILLNKEHDKKTENMKLSEKASFLQNCDAKNNELKKNLLVDISSINEDIVTITNNLKKRNMTIEAKYKGNTTKVKFENVNSSQTWKTCIENLSNEQTKFRGP